MPMDISKVSSSDRGDSRNTQRVIVNDQIVDGLLAPQLTTRNI